MDTFDRDIFQFFRRICLFITLITCSVPCPVACCIAVGCKYDGEDEDEFHEWKRAQRKEKKEMDSILDMV